MTSALSEELLSKCLNESVNLISRNCDLNLGARLYSYHISVLSSSQDPKIKLLKSGVFFNSCSLKEPRHIFLIFSLLSLSKKII